MPKIDYGSNQGRAYDEYLPNLDAAAMPPVAEVFTHGMHERQEPLPTPFSAEEYMQKLPSPWTGLNIALALVLAAAVSGLLLDAAARAGWL